MNYPGGIVKQKKNNINYANRGMNLEADLNGKSKHQIMQILRGCFADNGVEGHFTHYWKETDES